MYNYVQVDFFLLPTPGSRPTPKATPGSALLQLLLRNLHNLPPTTSQPSGHRTRKGNRRKGSSGKGIIRKESV